MAVWVFDHGLGYWVVACFLESAGVMALVFVFRFHFGSLGHRLDFEDR